MKLGVFTVLMQDLPLDSVLDHLQTLGVEAVELGTGAYPGNAHCDAAALLEDAGKRRAFVRALEERGLVISALSCHGNPLHPDDAIAREHHDVFERTLALAAELRVGQVVTFSGCPGADAHARTPSWIVAPWPPEFTQALGWQWAERVEPYWEKAAAVARSRGVRIAIEMHPNFVVYNPETMLRLRAIAPDVIGCNFDPSHLYWQGIDPCAAIRALRECIYHVHAKDCRINAMNTAVDGVLDAKSYRAELERSWIFRTVGYGHGELEWRSIVSTLRMTGYDHVMSIEHEDSLMSSAEGLAKAVAFLKPILISQPAGTAYWA